MDLCITKKKLQGFRRAKPTGSSRVSLCAKQTSTSLTQPSALSHPGLFPGCDSADPGRAAGSWQPSPLPRALCSSAQPIHGQIFFPGQCQKGETQSRRPSAVTQSSTGCVRLGLSQELLLEKQSWERFWPSRCPQHSLPCSEMPLQPCLQLWWVPICKPQGTPSPVSKEMHPTGESTKPILSQIRLAVRSRASSKNSWSTSCSHSRELLLSLGAHPAPLLPPPSNLSSSQ